MPNIPDDIFTEPEDASPDTLANLGPLRRLAGVWQSDQGVDINPKADGPERRVFRERILMEPIDPQTNGPQLLYGLRYHSHKSLRSELLRNCPFKLARSGCSRRRVRCTLRFLPLAS